MAPINPTLLHKIMKKLGVGRSRAYDLIDEKVSETSLPKNIAAIVVARDAGVSISRYASDEDLALIRGTPLRRAEGTPSGPANSVPSFEHRVSARRPRTGSGKRREKRKGNLVFVVYGRNEKLRKSLFLFLRNVGLKPIEWNTAIALTKKGSPYVGEILDAGFEKAVAAVVLFTPDDEAKLKDEFIKRGEPSFERKLTGQPRPNVLFEAGMAFGRHPESTVLVQVGNIRAVSDIAGRHVVQLTGSFESRHQLIVKLRAAGCPVDDSGDDWKTEGEFK